jgi:hypothetical protein
MQMVFAALVMIRAEILWFFRHVGVTVGKSKGARVMPIEMVLFLTNFCIMSFLCRHGVFELRLGLLGPVAGHGRSYNWVSPRWHGSSHLSHSQVRSRYKTVLSSL